MFKYQIMLDRKFKIMLVIKPRFDAALLNTSYCQYHRFDLLAIQQG